MNSKLSEEINDINEILNTLNLNKEINLKYDPSLVIKQSNERIVNDKKFIKNNKIEKRIDKITVFEQEIDDTDNKDIVRISNKIIVDKEEKQSKSISKLKNDKEVLSKNTKTYEIIKISEDSKLNNFTIVKKKNVINKPKILCTSDY